MPDPEDKSVPLDERYPPQKSRAILGDAA